MSEKNLDAKGRYRSKTLAFHVSPEEFDMLSSIVDSLGISKTAYMNAVLFNHVISIKGNPRVFSGLKRQLNVIYEELKRLNTSSDISDEVLYLMNFLCNIINQMMVQP